VVGVAGEGGLGREGWEGGGGSGGCGGGGIVATGAACRQGLAERRRHCGAGGGGLGAGVMEGGGGELLGLRCCQHAAQHAWTLKRQETLLLHKLVGT
jgi:hypothetical protein